MTEIVYVDWGYGDDPEPQPAKGDAWSDVPSDELIAALAKRLGPATELYFGPEFCHHLESLGSAIVWCNRVGHIPILFTYGAWFDEPEECGSIFDRLRTFGSFKIVLLIDRAHEQALCPSRLSTFLREAKRRFVIPEVMYVGDADEFPLRLYESEEVRKSVSVYLRRAPSAVAFLNQFSRLERQQALKVDARADEPRSLGSEAAGSPAAGQAADISHIGFNALVLETTYFCNAQCDHCYTSCGPKSPRTLMPLDSITGVLREAASLSCIKKRVHVGGGESTIFWPHLCSILRAARDLGFSNSIVTNGFWGSDRQRARSRVRELRECGVVDIEFSIDAMHQRYIKRSSINHILAAAADEGIRVILRLCTTRRDDPQAVLKEIDWSAAGAANVVTSRVVAVGRAKHAFDEGELYLENGIPLGSCRELLNLTIDPAGNTYPCCAGSEICPSLRLGNCFEDGLIAVLERSRFDYLLRALIHAGPSYFAGLLIENGRGDLLRDSYGNFCHLCNDLFSNEETVAALKSLFGARLTSLLTGPAQPAAAEAPLEALAPVPAHGT